MIRVIIFIYEVCKIKPFILFLEIFKNVSSSTSHIKTLRLSVREFKKILPNTFIYESILIKKLY